MTKTELREKYPDIHFIKTQKFIELTSKKSAEEVLRRLRELFIPDEDTPEFPDEENFNKNTRIYPLPVPSFPSVLKRMTAHEAGAWAITKCLQQHWEADLDNIQCCLANLEMDF